MPTSRSEVEGIAALTRPAADEAKTTKVVEELKVTLAMDAKLAAALDHGSMKELERVGQEAQENGSALQRLANQLGPHVCGRPEDGE